MSELTTSQRLGFLRKSFIFDALDEREKEELAKFSFVKTYKAGETIFLAGDEGQSMYTIAEGIVRVSIVTPNAKEVTLAELSKGDVLGEIAALDGRQRSASAKAASKCTLIVLGRREVLAAMTSNPTFATKLVDLLCLRIRRSDERMLEIAYLDLPVRLAKLLLRLSENKSDPDGEPLKKLSYSQSEIASMAGNTRENINRCFRKWQEADIIAIKDGWLILQNRELLEDVASSD